MQDLYRVSQQVQALEINLKSGNLKAEGREGKETGETPVPEGKYQLTGHNALPQANTCTSREGRPCMHASFHYSIEIHL